MGGLKPSPKGAKLNRPEYSVVEYCGIQRSGKTTLMVADMLYKDLSPDYAFGYEPEECYFNFWVDIPGVNIGNNQKMLEWLTRARKEQWVHKSWCLDEASQPPLFYARNSRDVLQTELVTSLWQMPKKGMNMKYTSNPGNSVDVQMRDATWCTVMPTRYHKELPREKQYVEFTVIHAYEMWVQKMVLKGCAEVQKHFDSYRPVI